MRHQRSLLVIAAVASATLWAYACGDGTTEPPPYFPGPATITVSPATTELTALGATVQLSAEVRDQNGAVMAGATVTWASSDAGAATVNASGLVTAVSNGGATITATAGSASGSATVTVAQQVSAVAVTPDTATVLEGDTLRLAATATDANGHAVTGAELAWASGDTAVAVVDASGLVTAVGTGEVQVTATAAGLTGRAELAVVIPLPTTVAVTPDTVVLTAVGQTAQLTAEVRDQAGRVMDGVPVSWLSAETTVAAVDASGLVTAVGGGAVTITATAGEASGDALVTVEIDLDRAALVALYNATDGPNWVNNTNWLTDAPLGEWYGVDTDAAGRVVRLGLSGRWDRETRETVRHGLKGEIPPELGGLAELQGLHLHRNELTGGIPAEIGELANLQSLDLGSNQLTGEIPPEFSKLTNLRTLGLYTNSLTGEIPPEIGNLANLQSINLSVNQLTGAIPSELGELTNLRTLGLSINSLTGEIPVEIGNLAKLRELYVNSNQLTGEIPPEIGNLANLSTIYLDGNQLTGAIPAEMGNLANLRTLVLYFNQLTGPIPSSFLQLELVALDIRWNENLCIPGTSVFLSWLRGIEYRDEQEPLCNAADVAALKSLFEATAGAEWTESSGWLGDVGVGDWYGVTSDSLGHVTELDLSRNGLAGRLPSIFGELVHMTELRIADNADLSGRLPLALAGLSLRALHYTGTGLCVPSDASFQTWLAGIPSHEGNGEECAPLTDREILEIFYDATGGPNWTNNANWLTEAPLRNWYGVEVDGEGRVSRLGIYRNNLTGAIPPELGNLAELTWLELSGNLTGQIPRELGDLTALTDLSLVGTNLTGSIPPELGNLAELTWLELSGNLTGQIPRELGDLTALTDLSLVGTNLTGSIPPELGNLARLERLRLFANSLTGPIPPELGKLAALTFLNLEGNNLTGPIPPELGNLAKLTRLRLLENNLTGPIPLELGNLASLWELRLASNDLSGSVPSELGTLTKVRWLLLANNAGLNGPLPQSLTGLDRLEQLLANGTGLCAPTDAVFQAWLNRAYKRRIAPCVAGELSSAYLTQAVQSREFPVPLVLGEKALLRVFPTARQATSEGIPLVRARFYVGGRETHVRDIPGKSDPIPTEAVEGDLSKSANAEIPDWVIQPGLEMVIEVDPDGALDPELGVGTRIPATGRLAVEVKAIPPLDLTVIPFVWTETHDSSIVDLVEAMAGDPENHKMLGDARTLLPIGALAVTAHEPVLSSTNSAFTLVSQTGAIRVMEGGTGHYMGMMSPPVTGASGWASGTRVNFSVPDPLIIAHELGHNMSLAHAPCGRAGGPDPSYPYSDGSIGAWGYDFHGGRLVHPSTLDLMSYCGPLQWISDYHFTNALRFRLHNEGSAAAAVSASTPSLLLWGGVGADSVPYLEPSFVIDAPTALPDSAGRTPDHWADCRRRPTLLAQLHHARDGRRGREFQLRLRAAGASRMGRQPRDDHAVRAGRQRHAGRR